MYVTEYASHVSLDNILRANVNKLEPFALNEFQRNGKVLQFLLNDDRVLVVFPKRLSRDDLHKVDEHKTILEIVL